MKSVSQLPFGSVPFRHANVRVLWGRETVRLNYLSAQCPFGTQCVRGGQAVRRGVSITFRLSALSAQIGRGNLPDREMA